MIYIFTLLLYSMSWAEPNLKDISFLIGCWESEDKENVVKESWLRSGTGLQGQGQIFAKDKVTFWETIKIELYKGNFVYTPSPMGKRSVSFLFVDRSAGPKKSIAFVNKKHDFPQEIVYSIKEGLPPSLEIDLSGEENKKIKTQKIVLKAIKCEEDAP
jgi:hypothetical protein